MKRFLDGIAARIHRWATPPPPPVDPLLPALAGALSETQAMLHTRQQLAFLHELVEARHMAGPGSWLPYGYRDTNKEGFAGQVAKLRETIPAGSIGAYGDIELALQNVEWRREINLTWLEFSRWGIQQIILICRLYYIKNPIVRRLIDVCADYVFARGVEVSSPDEAANETLEEFFEENKNTLGQHALIDLEKRKDYDGNLFFTFFTDTQDTGKVKVRTIDALEIMDVVSDPQDASKPQYYRRIWTQKTFDPATGAVASKTEEAWYPALGFVDSAKPKTIGDKPVMWDSPVYHRKAGAISSWMFGCPRSYPMIDWARTEKDYLTNCATVSQALAEISKVITTKGGQQALEGIKQQLSTQVGPGGGQSLWDKNPPAVTGATFASGPGTSIEAFKTQGAGIDPEKGRQFKLMCCMVAGVPETFLADVSTGNLATATSLDRPTETGFLARQEAWVEDLTIIATYVLNSSAAATGGKIREAKQKGKAQSLEVKVSFPAIREGDIPAQVKAVVEAMTLDNRGGQVVGIDEKEGVRKLGVLLDIPNWDEVVDSMYPSDYTPDRTKQDLAAPIGRAQLSPGGEPQLPGGRPQPVMDKKIEGALKQIARAIRLIEIGRAEADGSHAAHEHEPAATNGRA